MAAPNLAPFGEPASLPYLPQRLPDAAPVGGTRMDERGLEQFRPIFLTTGTVSQAAGSAYMEMGNTKAMAGVYGPRPTDRREAFSEDGHLGVDVKLASFATRARGRITQTPAERELSAQAATALAGAVQLDAFPKAAVDVYVCILEADGGELAAAISVGAAALADAGIPMRDLVAACSFARLNGSLVLDPCGAEQAQQEAGGTLAIMPTADQVTGVLLTGEWPGDSAEDALSLALGGCAAVVAVVRDTLRKAALEQ